MGDAYVRSRCLLSLPQGGVAGRIDADLPPLDRDQLLASLLATSPAVRAAQANVERAEATLRRAKREPIPDLILRGGLQQNFEPLANPVDHRVGLQGFAEIGVELHLWDHNQGGIAAERANLEAARSEVLRVEPRATQSLPRNVWRRLTAALDSPLTNIARTFSPRLERAYKLMTEQYGLMTASFPARSYPAANALPRTKLSTSTRSSVLGRAVSPCMDISSRVPLALRIRRKSRLRWVIWKIRSRSAKA